jgi:ATP-dependent Clp protease ATP-binding subunit ClpA
MRQPASTSRGRGNKAAGATPPPNALVAQLMTRVVGQPTAMRSIVPYIQMHQAGLAPEGRPIGVFLLLGPTGTGKTKTVEAVADVLHGSERNVVRIDCGEFQMEHEVAKLIGAPPGYLGHRETHPLLTQQRINAVTSEKSNISVVLFDEIEKAAPSLTRLLLGVLDKAILRLGDNTSVNFERSMIFLTSNLGARNMMHALRPDIGFQAGKPSLDCAASRLEKIGLTALRKSFSPEFLNRVDSIITYQPLDRDALTQILDISLAELQRHIESRLGARAFAVEIDDSGREFLLQSGTSVDYGARELKRTLHRHVTQPLAALVAGGQVGAGSVVQIAADPANNTLRLIPDA